MNASVWWPRQDDHAVAARRHPLMYWTIGSAIMIVGVGLTGLLMFRENWSAAGAWLGVVLASQFFFRWLARR